MIIAIDASSNEASTIDCDGDVNVQRATDFRPPREDAENDIIETCNAEEGEIVRHPVDTVSLVIVRDRYLQWRRPTGHSRNQPKKHGIIETQRSEYTKESPCRSNLNTFERTATTYSGVFMPKPNRAIKRGRYTLEKDYNFGILRLEQIREQERIEWLNSRVGPKLSAESDALSMAKLKSGPETPLMEGKSHSIILIKSSENALRCGNAGPIICRKHKPAKIQPISDEMYFDEEILQKQRGVLIESPANGHIATNWSKNTSECTYHLQKVENHCLEQSQEYRQSILSSIWAISRLHEGMNRRRRKINSQYPTIAPQSQARSSRCTSSATLPYISDEEETLFRKSSETSVTDLRRTFYHDYISERVSRNEVKDRLRHLLAIKNSVPYWNARHKCRKDDNKNEATIRVSMGKTVACQNYLVELCRALMLYGAPTHRLESCLITSSRVLGIQAQFLYIPGSIIICFEDSSTRVTNVQLICIKHEIHLRKLCDVHEVYKEVIHSSMSVEDAISKLTRVKVQEPKYPKWVLLAAHGFASASVGPFAFKAQFSDLPICFVLGLILGVLQLYVLPLSEPFAKIFEVVIAGITSFLSRYLGSLQGGDRFCFSAMAQSSIALILPGYMVVCGSLELQSRFIVAGSVRIIYAIIYSMFLGYGITIGTVIYGAFEKDAISEISCRNPISGFLAFLFVPVFTICLILINHGELSQMPIMTVISMAGYLVNNFTHRKFNEDVQLNSTFGALTIGLAANLYSRLGNTIDEKSRTIWALKSRFFSEVKKDIAYNNFAGQTNEQISTDDRKRPAYRIAAVVMLPAIFVQVPSGLSATGSLLSGLGAANEILHNSTNITTVPAGDVNSVALNFTFSVVRVAIGITVGLGLSDLLVYPFGKKKSGLFSF